MINTNGFNENIARKLSAVYGGGRISHAVLISGGTPEFRELLARHAAQLLTCESDDIKPCMKCESCHKAQANTNPDINTFEKATDKRYFVKKDVQQLCENVYRTPNESAVNVFILSELQNMNEECQNLLLKILEEPPSYSAFVITASSRNVILPTVLSRVSNIDLGEGSRSTGKNNSAVNIASDIAQAVLSADEYDIIKASAPLDGNKQMLEGALGELILIFRDALIKNVSGGEAVSSCDDVAQNLAVSLTKKQILDLYDCANELLSGIDKNKNQTLLLTSLSATFRQAVQL